MKEELEKEYEQELTIQPPLNNNIQNQQLQNDRAEFKQLLEQKEQHNKEQFYSIMARRMR